MQLLAVSGPFHYWGPVVDGQYLREAPARALQRSPRAKVDLLIGSSQDDGLINRAKAVKVGREEASGVPCWLCPGVCTSKSYCNHKSLTYLFDYNTAAEQLLWAKAL